MQNFKQQFNAGVNTDDDFELIDQGQYVNAENMRFGTTDKGQLGNIERIYGNQLVTNSYLPGTGTNKCIGSAEDEQDNRLLYCNYNSAGDHAIYCYEAGTVYKVLLNAQVEGGLNFSAVKAGYIHSIKVVNGFLIITDNTNEPRFINIEAGIKLNHGGYTTTQTAYVAPVNINLIKRPPVYRLTADKYYDSGFANNFKKNKAFQFCYRYHYKDNQISVLSTFSALVPYNTPLTADFNSIDVYLPFSETIADYVQKVDICAKDLDTNKIGIIKTFTKNNTDDATAITNHNSGTTELGFRFYNDNLFIPLDSVTQATASDSVPLLSGTLEIAKNRILLANNLSGYDTPEKTSLAVTVTGTDTGDTGSFTGTWKYLTLIGNDTSTPLADPYLFPYLVRDSDPTLLYYFNSARTGTDWDNGYVGTVPSTVNLASATVIGQNITTLVNYLKLTYYPLGSSIGTPAWNAGYTDGSTIGGAVTVNSFSAANETTYFKSNSSYCVSIAFYDRERRKCGVVKRFVKVKIPIRTYNQTVFSTVLNWTLSNTSAVDEIPVWAYYYQVHITKNITNNFFVQGRSYEVKYVVKEADGTFTYATTAFAKNTYAVAVDIQLLQNYGEGYVFTEGDVINIHKSTVTNYTLQVIGQEGNYVFCQPFDLGTISGATIVLFEIYTPFRLSEFLVFYETGDMIPVTNPATADRSYSGLAGQITGDVYSIIRKDKDSNDYIVESMSPNDLNWKNWHTDTGWPNFIDEIGQQRLSNDIVFSDVIIQGTKVNGLNKFQPLNVVTIDNQAGQIEKLQLAQKIQQEGEVVLAICTGETFSCYLGETELLDTNGVAYTARTNNVIGNTRVLQGSMGTSNPESVFDYNGLVEWFDKRNGCFVQYSNNGLFPISKNKLSRAANLFAQKISDDDLVIGGNDPYHKEFLFSIPYTEAAPKGNLEDYGTVYPYDIYDGAAKTLVYKHEIDKWVGAYTYNAESFIRLGNKLYSFKGGNLYLHNVDTGTIYGNTFKSRVMLSVNPNPGYIKTFHSIAIEANAVPDFVHFRTDNPYVQSSDLVTADFAVKEGIITAPLYRNRLDPNKTGTYLEKQMKGERLFGKYLLVMVEYSSNVQLKFFNTSCTINAGHYLAR